MVEITYFKYLLFSTPGPDLIHSAFQQNLKIANMKNDKISWSKPELEIYVLLLCANADAKQSEEEINLIRSTVNQECFDRIYDEFSGDSEEESLKKIESCVACHEYSHKELSEIQQRMKKVFLTDKRYGMMERNMERILNRILY